MVVTVFTMMNNPFFLLLITGPILTFALTTGCRKRLLYHSHYGYGYDIFCENLTDTNLPELRDIFVYNEVELTITNSHISNFTDNVFKNVKKLKELTISDSNITFSQGVRLFAKLGNLVTLNLVNIGLQTVKNQTLQELHQLKLLNLTGNKISKIATGSFASLQSVTTIDLSDNVIDNIGNVPLCNVSGLEVLVMSGNRLSSINNSSIACLTNLKKLRVDNNRIKQFCNITSGSITHLDLSSNSLETISDLNLPNLIEINLSMNNISTISSDLFLKETNLQRIDFDSNHIGDIGNIHLSHLRKLTYLKLTNNHISSVIINSSSLEELDLSYNEIFVLNDAIFHNIHNLKCLRLKANKIYHLDFNIFHELLNLNVLDLSSNSLIEINKFTTLETLKILRLNKNLIQSIDLNAFEASKKLEILDLSENRLESLNETNFCDLEYLKSLNISYNYLNTVSYQVLEPLVSLKILDVEGNLLTDIDYKLIINELFNLEVINVRSNLLSCEFLTKMIHHFKESGMNYTISENVELEQENVAGIYCKETASKVQDMENINNRILSDLLVSAKVTESSIGIYLVVIIVSVLAFLSLILLLAYKTFIWRRRKDYMMDELELIEN